MGAQSTGQGDDSQQSIREIIRQELGRVKESSAKGSFSPEEDPESSKTSTGPSASGGSKGIKALRHIIHEEILRMQGKANGTQKNPSGADSDSQDGSKNNGKQSISGSGQGMTDSSKTASAPRGANAKSKKAAVQSKGSGGKGQTVAQVLTQAQYELSEELEMNLRKLRSVIRQSEEIAKKIEQVLGHGSKGSGNQE